MRDFNWSPAEKKIARRIFDAAFDKECAATMQHLRELAARARNPEDIWAIHDYLTLQRRAIDQKYDYRYSQLTMVFGRLLREKWIGNEDIEGLGEEKIKAIRRIASL